MKKEEIHAAIESMLFAMGEPVPIDKMAEVLDVSYNQFMTILYDYMDNLNHGHRGLKAVRINNSIQMVSKSEYHPFVAKILETKSQKNLSQAALETLSIIAYNQPVTKAMIESVRGVDSYNSVMRLLERDLIEQKGRLDTAGRPMLYGTTDEFLRVFGMEHIGELPILETGVLESIRTNDNLTFDDITADFSVETGEKQ